MSLWVWYDGIINGEAGDGEEVFDWGCKEGADIETAAGRGEGVESGGVRLFEGRGVEKSWS